MPIFGIPGSLRGDRGGGRNEEDRSIKECRLFEYASLKKPFAGRVVCGLCDRAFGRRIWNSTDDRLRRVVWQCSAKYEVKGRKGCDNKHIDDGVLYQGFVDVFNALVENKAYFMEKWQERLRSGNALERYKARQFIDIIADAGRIDNFDIDLYCAFVEKTAVMGAPKNDCQFAGRNGCRV